MQRTEIAKIYGSPETFAEKRITVCGWVRTIRDSKALGFIDLNDGSYFKGIQIVFEEQAINNFTEIAKQNVGTALAVTGTLVLTPEAKQPFEIKAEEIVVEGASSPEYPLQKKRHSMEYLRTIAHLRPRANTFSAAFRIRSAAAFAIHQFFGNQNLLQMQKLFLLRGIVILFCRIMLICSFILPDDIFCKYTNPNYQMFLYIQVIL